MTDATDIANNSDFDEFQDELKPGTQLLQGQYTIDKYLNSGGFAITYLARDSLDRQVVIKECFPGSFCRRSHAVVQARSRAHQSEYKAIVRLFIQEARGLAKLNHPNIVGVHQVFEDNSTAYMALDLIKGRDLLDTLEDEKKILKPNDIANILKKLLGAIKYMHDQNVLHRDISPDNILLNEDLEPILIDFGAAREQASKVGKVLSALRVVKDGYSPQEFYVSGSIQGPSSDLYALGASFYHVITGEIPPDSQVRLASAAAREPDPYKPLHGNIKGYDDIFLMAIDKSLRLMPKDRIQSAGEWLAKIEQKEYVKSEPDEDAVTATVAQMMQQPDLVTPKEQEAKPEPAAVAPAPVTTAAASSKPAKNRLDEIANEMASEDAEKKKVLGKLLAGVAVAAALGGAVVYTQTDLFTGGNSDQDGSEISTSEPSESTSQTAASESNTANGNTVGATVNADVAADNGEVETTDVQPSDPETLPTLEHVPDTPGNSDEPETRAPEGADQNISVARGAENATEPEELASFTPVNFEDAEIGLTEPKITDITEVSLVLPSIEGPEISGAGLVLSTPSEPVIADLVKFDIEASSIAPEFSTEYEPSLPGLTIDSDLKLSSDDNAFTLPKPGLPSLEFASLSPLAVATIETQPIISTAPAELSSLIKPATYVATNWSAVLPFEADESNGVMITEAKSDAASWMKEGVRITTVNGTPVESLAEITGILQSIVDESDAADISAVIGVTDTTGIVIDHDTTLKLIGNSSLEDSTSFETVFDNGAWITTVVKVSDQNAGEFVVGDIMIANVEAKEKIEGRTSLADILNQGFSTGQDSLRFIVDRNGSNWFATVRISQVGGFQKTSLNNANSGD